MAMASYRLLSPAPPASSSSSSFSRISQKPLFPSPNTPLSPWKPTKMIPSPPLRLCKHRPSISIKAQQELTESKGLSFEDGGRWLNCTTRHIRIYAGYIDPVSLKMDQTQLDKLSLILDPDDEFIWPGETPDKVFEKFTELVNNYAVSVRFFFIYLSFFTC